jgi:hypothetical protein
VDWDDPQWTERDDDAGAASRRWLQAWWRATVLELPAGPATAQRRRGPVASMLPAEVSWDANFLSDEASEAARRLVEHHAGGIVDTDRLRRNLLSSQPLCVNLFGHLQHHPEVLLSWLRSLGFEVADVEEVRVEWAPPPTEHFGGGSAFDAMIVYRTETGRRGFVAVETKYAENLARQKTTDRSIYRRFTRDSVAWRRDAELRLNRPRTAQLWLNTLLAQSTVQRGSTRFDEARVLLLSCAADHAALEATVAVAAELTPDHGRWVDWSSYEHLLNFARQETATATWASTFDRRYLDTTPVTHLVRVPQARSVVGDAKALDHLRRATRATWVAADAAHNRSELLFDPSTSAADVNTLDAMVAHHHLTEATDALHAARLLPRSKQP